MAISTVIPNLSVPTNSFSGSLTNALTGINSFSNHLIEASPSINTCSQNNMEFSHKTPKQQKIVELNQFALTSGLMSTSLINSIPENNELLGKTLSNSTQSLIEKRSPRKKRKQEFKILDFNVGFSENPLAIKRPNLNEYEWNLKGKKNLIFNRQ